LACGFNFVKRVTLGAVDWTKMRRDRMVMLLCNQSDAVTPALWDTGSALHKRLKERGAEGK